MGSYLVIDGHENNTKSISYPMITLIRESLPAKKSLYDEKIFGMTQKDIATVLNNVTKLLSEDMLGEYVKEHPDDYGMNNGLEEIKEDFEWIQRCFAEVLSEMVIYGKYNILCNWR